jgi:hypothetical protein
MSVLELPRKQRQGRPDWRTSGWRKYVAVERTISGDEGSLISYGSNADFISVVGATTTSTAGGAYWIVETAVILSTQEYDHGLVTIILDADSKPPEAKFTNVIDMMNWLDRD